MLFKDLNHQWKEISLERTLKNILGKTCDLFVLSCVMSGICTFKMGCNQFWMGILISINKYEISRTFYNVGAYILIFQKVQFKINNKKNISKRILTHCVPFIIFSRLLNSTCSICMCPTYFKMGWSIYWDGIQYFDKQIGSYLS